MRQIILFLNIHLTKEDTEWHRRRYCRRYRIDITKARVYFGA